MSQESNPKSIWSVNQSHDYLVTKIKSNDLVMAWAIDSETRKPVYIFELDAAHRGSKCQCLCVSCEMPLTAVNVAKLDYIQRPHFKHPKGAQRDSCLVLAARFAIAQQLLEQGFVELPQRKVSSRFVGLSGKEYHAWEVRRPERVRVIDTHFDDKATAVLTLEDGRKIVVTLTGGVVEQTNSDAPFVASISIDTGGDLSIAGMAPDELKAKMKLLWAGACWNSHWEDSTLLQKARNGATALAINELDCLDDNGTIPTDITDLTKTQKRETLLHLEVKRILEREKRIRLPQLVARVKRDVPSSKEFVRETIWPAEYVLLQDVQLEKKFDRIVPDVIAKVVDPENEGQTYPLSIEITVTNTIDDERMRRIRSTNLAALEIDLSRFGGIITREQLNDLVIEELVAKQWLHHPKIAAEVTKLEAQLDAELLIFKERSLIRSKYRETSIEEWASRYEEAFVEHQALMEIWYKSDKETVQDNPSARLNQDIQLWENKLENATFALTEYGFPQSIIKGNNRIYSILKRLFSIKLNTVVGYTFDSCWQVINTCQMDRDDSKTWHTLYLIAIHQYNPQVTSQQKLKIQEWRQQVLDSINSGSQEYLRSTRYDAFLALLFPEMKAALANPLGKKVVEDKPRYEQFTKPYSSADTTEDGWLKGKALQEWIRKNPVAAKNWYGPSND